MDVDVDLRHRHLAWRRAKRRDRTSNRERLNSGLRKAAWLAGRGNGRHNKGGEGLGRNRSFPAPPVGSERRRIDVLDREDWA